MTDAPMTREEAERLLALCEAATEPPWYWPFISKKLCSDPVTMAFDIERRDAEFIITARTALPRALREVLRLQREVESEKVNRVLDRYGMQDGSLLRDLRAELDRLRDQLDRVRVMPDNDTLMINAGIAAGNDVGEGGNIEWLRAALRRALGAAGIVPGSDG